MKRHFSLLLTLLFSLSLPLGALAMSHGSSGHDHGANKKMEHGSHDDHGHENMLMLGDATVQGVKGSAHLSDVREAMKKAGMDATHHLMVMFMDTGSGKPITEGNAAVKVTGPDGKISDPIKLVGMEGHFGADIALKQKGEYKFEIGSKLPDGQKRQFEFKYDLK